MAEAPGYGLINSSLVSLHQDLAILIELHQTRHELGPVKERLEDLQVRLTKEEKILRTRFALIRPDDAAEQTGPELRFDELVGNALVQEIHARMRSCEEFSRSLEEYFRFFSRNTVSKSFKQTRYELYGIERESMAITGTFATEDGPLPANAPPEPGRIRKALAFSPLYFILDETICVNRDPLKVGFDAIRGGVRMLQVRFKTLTSREWLDISRKLRQVCSSHDCLLIINDRLDIAMLSRADGIHVGASDIRISDIRSIAPNMLIGVTARKLASARRAVEQGADYIGSGTVYASKTKTGLPIIGARGIQSIARAVDIPVIGIGGINQGNCQKVLAAGAAGFCSIKPFASRRSVVNLASEFRKVARLKVAKGKR